MGEQMNISDKLVQKLFRRKWYLSALGDLNGTVTAGGQAYTLNREAPAIKMKELSSELRFQTTGGTFGDSMDDFLLCNTKIQPEKENFEISALFTVKEASPSLSWQSGYGVFVADTVSQRSKNCRYRNHLGIGRFRTRSTVKQSAGMRVVSGYQDADASEIVGNRILDLSRNAEFPSQSPRISVGETYRFSLKKTNAGFTGSISFQRETQSFLLPGCDFLMQQNPHAIYAGFAIAGALTVEVNEIHFLCSSGQSSITPEGTIRMALPDYPFPRKLLSEPLVPNRSFPYSELFVSTDGKADGDGSLPNPLDLQTALTAAHEGQTIWLMDGIYCPKEPYYVPKQTNGSISQKITLRAQHAGKAILDGSDLLKKTPLFILRGNTWHLKDLVFRNSPSSGLMICSSRNLIDHCEAYQNRDTGILICTYPGTDRTEWPKGNHVFRRKAFHWRRKRIFRMYSTPQCG